jgi:hypothetical protein
MMVVAVGFVTNASGEEWRDSVHFFRRDRKYTMPVFGKPEEKVGCSAGPKVECESTPGHRSPIAASIQWAPQAPGPWNPSPRLSALCSRQGLKLKHAHPAPPQ